MNATSMVTMIAALVLASAPWSRAEPAAPPEAVSCPKCETVWVRVAIGEKAKAYTRVGKMVCDDCRTAVENVFAGGRLEHACKSCGDLRACSAIQAEFASADQGTAVTCSKCETTWVRRGHQMGKITVYTTDKSMNCSHCDAAAKGRLSGTDTRGSCTMCGEGLANCE